MHEPTEDRGGFKLYKGHMGAIELHADHLVIRRSEGLAARMVDLGGTREIPLTAITGVTHKPARFVDGWLQLQLGGAQPRSRTGDPNTLVFRRTHSSEFDELAELLKRQVDKNVQEGVSPAAAEFDKGASRLDRARQKNAQLKASRVDRARRKDAESEAAQLTTPAPLQEAKADAVREAPVAQSQLAAPEQTTASQSAGWWDDIKPHTILPRCHYVGAKNAKEIGTLKATEAGIEYTGKTKVSCPWSGIANIEIIESRTRRGRQRSAVGIGPVGLAVVGASMLQNKRAAQIVITRVVTLTTKQGQRGNFVPTDSSTQQVAPVQAIIAHLQRSQGAATQVGPGPSVADELKKLVDLKDAGLLTDEEFAAQRAKLLGS